MKNSGWKIIVPFFFKKLHFLRDMFGSPNPRKSLSQKKNTCLSKKPLEAESRKRWKFENLHLRQESKKISWRTSLPDVFLSTQGTPGHIPITDMAKNFQHPYQQKIRIRKNDGKTHIPPISFQIFTTFNTLHQKPPTHGLENVNELNSQPLGRWRFTAVCCATHPKAVFESPVGEQ